MESECPPRRCRAECYLSRWLDSDTLAAIAGPIAEALHGIPDELNLEQVEHRYLEDAPDIRTVVQEMYRVVGE